MGKHYILAIDQGTTGNTTLIVEVGDDLSVTVQGRGYAEFTQIFPQPGWVEHDLEEIWETTLTSIRQALERAAVSPKDIAAIGITNQRETTCLWRHDGSPCQHAIVWQDRRTSEHCARLKRDGHEETVRHKTGLVVDPYFSGTKLAWALNEGGLREQASTGKLRFGTTDAWLLWKLTGGTLHATDATNASRTMLYDIRQGAWDADLAAMLGDIPLTILPEVRPSSGVFGTTKDVPGLPDGIPIAGVAGDQHAALFGQACLEPGMAKCTYGTGAFALVNTGDQMLQSAHGLVTTLAWQLGDKPTYALEGSIFVAGAVVQWLRDGLGFFPQSDEIEALAASVEDTGGVVLVPALTGLGAPHWLPEARGLISGITRGTTRGHIARAALEGIALQVYDLLDAMRKDSRTPVSLLRVDGGASANNLLMQIQADLMGINIHRPHVLDSTAMGAAFLAGLGVGIFSDVKDVQKAWRLERAFSPQMSRKQVGEKIHAWRTALMKA